MSFGFSLGDFLSVAQLAWRITQACCESGSDFAELQSEALSMHTVLNATQDVLERARPTTAQVERLLVVGKGCRDVLIQVDAILKKYRSLGSSQRRLRDKLRWHVEKKGNVRIRLMSHTTMLASINSTITQYVHVSPSPTEAEVQANFKSEVDSDKHGNNAR